MPVVLPRRYCTWESPAGHDPAWLRQAERRNFAHFFCSASRRASSSSRQIPFSVSKSYPRLGTRERTTTARARRAVETMVSEASSILSGSFRSRLDSGRKQTKIKNKWNGRRDRGVDALPRRFRSYLRLLLFRTRCHSRRPRPLLPRCRSRARPGERRPPVPVQKRRREGGGG